MAIKAASNNKHRGKPAALCSKIGRLPLIDARGRWKGCSVTGDALSCRSDLAEEVRAQRAHYALALKANQPLLLAEAQAAFERAGDSVRTFETRHGRQDRRSGRRHRDQSDADHLWLPRPSRHPPHRNRAHLRHASRNSAHVSISSLRLSDRSDRW